MTTATLVWRLSLRLTVAGAAVAEGAAGRYAAGPIDIDARQVGAEQPSRARCRCWLRWTLRLRWCGVGHGGAVVDGDDDGEDVAEPVRALVLEEALRFVREERVGLVGGCDHFGHRHVDRAIAGLGGWVFDSRELGRLADTGELFHRGATGEGEAQGEEGGEFDRLHVCVLAQRPATIRPVGNFDAAIGAGDAVQQLSWWRVEHIDGFADRGVAERLAARR